MALRDDLKAILVAAEAPAELEKFLVTKNLLQIDQLALMASDEDRLEDKCFPILKAGGVPVDGLQKQITIKKAWHLARTAMTESKKVHTGQTHACLPSCMHAWSCRYT